MMGNNNIENMNNYNFKGFLITTKSVDDICFTISEIRKMNSHKASNDKERKALCKTYCEKTYRLLEECFVQDMWEIERAKKILNRFKNSDNLDSLYEAKTIADYIMLYILSCLSTVIHLKDFPSCKELLNMEKDVATKCAKDLVQNKIVKAGIHGIILMSKANDLITISDVWNFYANIIKEFEREVREENWQLSQIEQVLFAKAQAECGYCFLAMLKTDCNITNEMKEMMDEAKANNYINDFEKHSIPNNASFMTMQHP